MCFAVFGNLAYSVWRPAHHYLLFGCPMLFSTAADQMQWVLWCLFVCFCVPSVCGRLQGGAGHPQHDFGPPSVVCRVVCVGCVHASLLHCVPNL